MANRQIREQVTRNFVTPGSDAEIASLLCNHNVVNCALAGSAIRWVREGRRTPAEAVARLIRLCPCGEVNVRRAVRVLEHVRDAALHRTAH
jgi:hypothetical protein